MPTCIYCRTQTTGKEGLPHVIPEAPGPNDLVLPRGAECDKCNHYFGRKLEPNLYRYPGVALALQLWGIHGKKGLRKRLSTIERTDEGKTQARGHSLESQIDRAARAWGVHAHSKNQLRYKISRSSSQPIA
jgi:hypothetical protein